MKKPHIIPHDKERGEWAELRFMARAAEHGLKINKPWGETSPYDFVVGSNGKLARVQVKSTLRRHARSYEHWRVIRRIGAPPSLPRFVFRNNRPRPTHRPKHIAAQNPCADVFERPFGKIIVDALASASLTLHLLEGFGRKESIVQFESADAEGIFDILPRPRTEAIE